MANLRGRWDGLSLVQQFSVMACIVVGAAMIALGSFASAEIEEHVVDTAAAATALYVNNLDRPYLQGLTGETTVREESLRALDNLFKDTERAEQIVSVKICLTDGRIVYSTRPEFIGRTMSRNPRLINALKGEVSAQFRSPRDEAGAIESDVRAPLLEIYVPIHEKGGDNIIAAAEFLTDATGLRAELEGARRESWIVVCGVVLLQVILLYGVVWQGNRTIESQRAVLVGARRASIETSERFLRRVGADLHDGPSQLISLALLRLDTLRPLLASEHAKSKEFETIRTVLQDCLREIRHLSAGLAPPHLDNLPLWEVLELAVRQHEQRTGSAVSAAIDKLPANVSSSRKVCIYRFVQEGLNNAYRHAAGIGQTVHASSDGRELTVEVADNGPGFSPSNGNGLGLAGLRDRVEALGGTFSLATRPGSGTRLRASFQVADTGAKDA